MQTHSISHLSISTITTPRVIKKYLNVNYTIVPSPEKFEFDDQPLQSELVLKEIENHIRCNPQIIHKFIRTRFFAHKGYKQNSKFLNLTENSSKSEIKKIFDAKHLYNEL